MQTDDKKVAIKVYYTSSLGTMLTKDYTENSIDEAKSFVEKSIPTWRKPEIQLEATTREENGYVYDVTSVVEYRFSHAEIIDYTDGREKTENK